MKKLLCALIALCMCMPMAVGMADGSTAVEVVPVEFETPPADDATLAASSLARIAQMDGMLRHLALQTYHGGAGWDSPESIVDPWAAIYSYINAFELGTDAGWALTDDSYTLIPAVHVRQLFTDMYGTQYDQLPQLNRMYSAIILYEETSDCYAVTGADGDTTSAVLGKVELTDGGATVTYKIIGQYDKLSADELAGVTITLESGAATTYGFRPVSAELSIVEN